MVTSRLKRKRSRIPALPDCSAHPPDRTGADPVADADSCQPTAALDFSSLAEAYPTQSGFPLEFEISTHIWQAGEFTLNPEILPAFDLFPTTTVPPVNLPPVTAPVLVETATHAGSSVETLSLRRLSATQVRTWADRSLVAIFCALLLVPGFAALTGLSDNQIEQTQRRAPAPLAVVKGKWRGPVWWPKSKSIHEFPVAFENWFNDRWGFRRNLTQTFAAAKYAGLTPSVFDQPRNGDTTHSPVLIGQDGWLFYAGHGGLQAIRGDQPFSAVDLAQWKEVLTARSRWLKARGIRYLVVLAPDKSTIYPDQLPRTVRRVGPGRGEQWVQLLKEIPDLELVDLRQPVQAASLIRPTFYQTDSHWNPWGGYVGACQILQQLSRSWEDVSVPDLNDGEWRVEQIVAEGDLTRMLDVPLPLTDWQVQPVTPFEQQARVTLGRHRHQRLRRSQSPSAPLSSAVVLHDSFCVAMMPTLNEQFREVRYISYCDFPADQIQAHAPRVVIQELVERSLMTVRPINPPGLGSDLVR